MPEIVVPGDRRIAVRSAPNRPRGRSHAGDRRLNCCQGKPDPAYSGEGIAAVFPFVSQPSFARTSSRLRIHPVCFQYESADTDPAS